MNDPALRNKLWRQIVKHFQKDEYVSKRVKDNLLKMVNKVIDHKLKNELIAKINTNIKCI